MAVITQEYDVDLKSTGAFPVVKCSQFDTGSRMIVFTVYDGWDLADIDGCVARVDGTRSDGVEFSRSCTVGTGSKVSFEITQEMTKSAGKHAAELVIFDANGNPAGTQNFIIEVEPATMVRDSAASADDRTLYDQFTDSVSKVVSDKMTSVDDKMAGVDTKISTTVDTEIDKRITPDTLLGAWRNYGVSGTASFTAGWAKQAVPLKPKQQSDGADAVYGPDTADLIYIYKPGVYQVTFDGWYNSDMGYNGRDTWIGLYSATDASDDAHVKRSWEFTSSQGMGNDGKVNVIRGAVTFCVPSDGLPYRMEVYTAGSSSAALTDSSLRQMVITRISSGSNVVETTVVQKEDGTPVTAGSATAQGNAIDELYTVSKQ